MPTLARKTDVLSDLDLRYIDGDDWEIRAPFRVYSVVLKSIVEVPAGHHTDFNSTPRWSWWLLPPTEYGEAAVLHDEGYRTGTLAGQIVTQAICDQVHREFLIWKKAPDWKVKAMYRGLRLFGWIAWRKHRKELAEAHELMQEGYWVVGPDPHDMEALAQWERDHGSSS